MVHHSSSNQTSVITKNVHIRHNNGDDDDDDDGVTINTAIDNSNSQHRFSHFQPLIIPSSIPSSKNSHDIHDNNRSKRRPIPVPNENKDDAYWERRRRNNESAKRSRESRRRKEFQATIGIMMLKQENLKLKAENNFLREELQRIRQNELFKYLMMSSSASSSPNELSAANSPANQSTFQ